MRMKNETNLLYGTLTKKDRDVSKLETAPEALVPGIHNIASVGSSPLRRGVKKDLVQPRDQVYGTRGGAG